MKKGFSVFTWILMEPLMQQQPNEHQKRKKTIANKISKKKSLLPP